MFLVPQVSAKFGISP